MDDTIFDKIIRKEISADIVYEDETVCAFRDAFPQAPVHILVIPKQKIEDFNSLDQLEPDFLGRFMQRISKIAQNETRDGYRIVFNAGQDGQQTVDYLHAHILGGRTMNWPPG